LLLPSQAFCQPVLTISKSDNGPFTVGTNGTYTITVRNTGNADTSGTITVTDTLANGLGFVSGTGTGWTCSAVGQVVTCTNPGPIGASGGSSTITLTVSVCAAPSVTNQASVSGGGAPDATSNLDTPTVNRPVFTITKSHTGNFTVGTNGTYTITVTNTSTTADSCGKITVTDTLPTGLTFIVGTGTGWSCSAAAQVVTCTSTAVISKNNGSSVITLTVSVGVSAIASVDNSATVSGGGTAGSVTSNTDTTTVLMTVKSGPGVYVSTAGGQQILAADGAVGTTVAIHTETIANSFSPEDIIVGPDKRIYICDPPKNKIYRVRQDNTGFEKIYDSSIPTFPNNPTGPEGPSFDASGNLYFNTNAGESSSGVWVITGATGAVPLAGSFTPSNVFSGSTPGEGTALGTASPTSGQLLFVERSSNKVLSCNPSSCGSPTTRIQNPLEGSPVLDNPIGIAVRKSDGHIFVANRGSLNNIIHFNSSGTFQETYASFAGNGPYFLEFDALGRLYVVTAADDFTGGQVWRIDPPGGETNLVFLVALSNSITGVNSDKAVGLGVAPNAAITKTYSSGTKSNTFDFSTIANGNLTDKVTISFSGVSTAFDLTVFREEVPEALLALQLATNFSGIPCAEYSSDLGTCVAYEEGVNNAKLLEPLPAADFAGPVNLQLFYTPSGGSGVPVLAHALDSNLQNPVDEYDENELTGFTLATTVVIPSDPTGMNGDSGGISRHVALNTPQTQAGTTFCGFQVPVPGQTFSKPQAIPVRFKIAVSGGNCHTGPYVTNAVSQLWLFNTTTQEFVTPTSKSNTGNFFFANSTTGQNNYNIDTKNLAPGTYIFTMTSNSVSAQFSFFVLTQ